MSGCGRYPIQAKGLADQEKRLMGEATESQQKTRNKKSKADGTMPGNHQGRDPRKHKKKAPGSGLTLPGN